MVVYWAKDKRRVNRDEAGRANKYFFVPVFYLNKILSEIWGK